MKRPQYGSQQKACHDFNNVFTLFTAVPVLSIMYTNKDSNLISDLRTKYRENSVRSFRKWEIITKKMAGLQESHVVYPQMYQGQYNSCQL